MQGIFSYINKLLKSRTFAHKSNLKWVMLILCCIAPFGSYFGHDTPASLQTPLQKYFDISSTKYNLIFSCFYIPSIITPVVGGIVSDKLGVRFTFLMASIFVLLGQVSALLGVSSKFFSLILLGRALHGIGNDCIIITKLTMISKWFVGGNLALAQGLTLCVSRLASSMSSWILPEMVGDSTNGAVLAEPFLLGCVIQVISLVAVLIANYIDQAVDTKIYKGDDEIGAAMEKEKVNQSLEDDSVEDKIQFFKDFLKQAPYLYVLLVGSAVIHYPVFFTFMNNANDMMVQRFGYSVSQAGKFISIVYVMATFCIAMVGYIADKYGQKITMLLFAAGLLTFIHFVLLILGDRESGSPNFHLIVVLFLLGEFYSLYSALIWPCLTLAVNEKVRSTAYGFCLSCENLVLALVPLVTGSIHDATIGVSHGYYYSEFVLFMLAAAGFYIMIQVNREDGKNGGLLNMPVQQKVKETKWIPLENVEV